MSEKAGEKGTPPRDATLLSPLAPRNPPPPPSTPPKPQAPKMGSIVESYLGKGDWSIICGGKPNSTWTGFTKDVSNDSQLRPLDNAHKVKAKKQLKEALPEQMHYKKGVPMHQFSKDLFEHFQSVGLDTVTYLPDLATVNLNSIDRSVTMHSVVEEYARFGTYKERAIEVAKHYRTKLFDPLDIANSESAKAILFKSMDRTSKSAFDHLIKPQDCFAVVWIHFISTAVIMNEDTILQRRTVITTADPKKYEHENISKLCKDLKPHVEALVNVGRYESSTTSTMMQSILSKVTPNKTFNLAVGMKLHSLKEACKPLAFLQPYEQNEQLKKKKLDPISILRFLEDEFLSLFNATPCLWLPATGKTNPLKALLAQPVEVEDKNSMAQLLLLLLQKSNRESGNTGGACFNCGSDKHWAADCPKKDGNGKGSKQKGRGGNGKNNGTRTRGGEKTGWKYQKPSDPSKPLIRNKKTFFWCDKCGRYSTTHDTAKHHSTTHDTAKHQNNKSGSGTPTPSEPKITYAAALDPSLWLAADIDSIVNPPSPAPIIGWMVPFFAAVSLALFFFGRNCMGVVTTLIQNLVLAGSIIASNASSLFQVALQSSSSITALTFKVIQSLWMLDPCFFIAPVLWIGTGLYLLLHKRKSVSSSAPKYKRAYRRRLQQFSKKQKLRFSRLLQRCLLGDTLPKQQQVKGRFRRMHRKGKDSNFCSLEARRARQCWRRQYNAAQFVSQSSNCINNPSSNAGRGRAHRRICNAFINERPVHTRRSCQSSYHVHSPVTRLTASQRALLTPSFASFFSKFDNKTSQAPADHSFPVIWDSGASCCVSNCRDDFISFSSEVGEIITTKSLGGLTSSGKYKVEGEGHVIWYAPAVDGTFRAFKLPCAFIPTSEVRLLSTKVLWDVYQEPLIIKGDALLEGTRKPVSIPSHKNSNLLITMCTNEGASINQKPSSSKTKDFLPALPAAPDPSSILAAFGATSATSASNDNLSEAQKCLLRWHYRLGHVGFNRIKFLLGSGALAESESAKRLHRAASSSSLELPKCRACLHAKQRVRSPPKHGKGKVSDHPGVLKQDNLLPGQAISVDHMICSQPGRRFNTRGKESDKSKFKGACVFLDHASNFINVQFQSVLTSHATLESKANFESICRDVGVVPSKYVMDNAKYFTSKEFTAHMSEFRQIQSFAGVGAHHQNAIAERAIQTITSISRAMMIHSALHWPEVADSTLWPMAIKQAVWLWNHMPNPSTGLSPSDVFTRSRYPLAKLHDIHVFECPAYVLEKTLADGKKFPRWKPRSTQCVYLGRADEYASTVYSLLNLHSGSITPQYHVVMDDWFATVSSSAAALPDFNSPEWIEMFGKTDLQYFDDDQLDSDAVRALSDSLVDARQRESSTNSILERFSSAKPHVPLVPSSDEPTASSSVLPPMPTSVGSTQLSPLPTSTLRENSAVTASEKPSVANGSSVGPADGAGFEPNKSPSVYVKSAVLTLDWYN